MARACSLIFAALPFEGNADLADALVALGVLSVVPQVRSEDLASAVTLRAVLERAMTAAGTGASPSPRDVETLNSYAADEPPILALTASGGLLRIATDPVRCALSAIARDAIEVIALRASDLRRCDGCDAHFLDDSRGRRRRWCSMTRCGNRAKVAGYRARRQQ